MFAGRGSICIEAQRLGLRVYSSDLNPVAVTIQKALLQYPQAFGGLPPVNPEAQQKLARGMAWNGKGADGLAEDVRYYGRWIRAEAKKRIGHHYPKAQLPGGTEVAVSAWLWTRTVVSPNPAANGVHVPLANSFVLSSKKNREAIVVPVIERGGYRFSVKSKDLGIEDMAKAKSGTKVKSGTKTGREPTFTCLVSTDDVPVHATHIKAEGMAGRMDARLMAVVAEGKRGRAYLDPTEEMERAARKARPMWRPTEALPKEPRAIWCPLYGLTTFANLFTDRQLVALTAFSSPRVALALKLTPIRSQSIWLSLFQE